MTEPAEQIAALPISWTRSGKLRVLMVTSRDTGRWVMPKGWTMARHKPWQAAAIEALEEAGAEGTVLKTPIGEYSYDKVLEDGSAIPCRVRVYPMVVERLKRRWKESGERTRRWFAPKAAARSVDESDLAALLRGLKEEAQLAQIRQKTRLPK
ncbi:NUDIX hydrolase [Paralimibaculum aggregatum]|uniref:NUDIX hydrolase n=1 Tax=Paralimibaculum aggregatum TaxID=3036245 RepID=A0ABQ6LTI4_9RHOB|nr:NUDIX domain-containing protein [Limibaculum sp. NKW23]GMG85380.1 NUDIX hydrolase [Limibaculum sp. NKW23]